MVSRPEGSPNDAVQVPATHVAVAVAVGDMPCGPPCTVTLEVVAPTYKGTREPLLVLGGNVIEIVTGTESGLASGATLAGNAFEGATEEEEPAQPASSAAANRSDALFKSAFEPNILGKYSASSPHYLLASSGPPNL